jgi:hypothetical protein
LAQRPPTKKPVHPPKMKQARQARATIITPPSQFIVV